MDVRYSSLPSPDVIAVRRDLSYQTGRGQGRRISSDALSVYLKGGPRYRLDNQTYDFAAPVAMLVAEGTLDQDLQQGRLDGIFVLFRGRGLLRKADGRKGQVLVSLGKTRLPAPNFKQISATDAHNLAAIIREIADVRDAGTTGRMRRVSLLFQAIAGYCEARSRTGKEGIHREAVRLRQLIEQRAFEDALMADVYRELDLSAAHAGTLFRAAFGVTPVAYRTQLRLRKARELLVSSQLNVGQAALAVGFADALYFSRVFRKAFGATPSSLIYDFGNTRR